MVSASCTSTAVAPSVWSVLLYFSLRREWLHFAQLIWNPFSHTDSPLRSSFHSKPRRGPEHPPLTPAGVTLPSPFSLSLYAGWVEKVPELHRVHSVCVPEAGRRKWILTKLRPTAA